MQTLQEGRHWLIFDWGLGEGVRHVEGSEGNSNATKMSHLDWTIKGSRWERSILDRMGLLESKLIG